MKRLIALIVAVALGSCSKSETSGIYLQRFFGECTAEYGTTTDLAKAEGECGLTSMINKFTPKIPAHP